MDNFQIVTRSYQALDSFKGFKDRKVFDCIFNYDMVGMQCIDNLKKKHLIIDEFFYLSYNQLRIVHTLAKKGITIWAMGDPNQLQGVDGCNVPNHYLEDIFDRFITIPWHADARMDHETYDSLQHFTKTGEIKGVNIDKIQIKPSVQHLAFTNEKCDEINNLYSVAGHGNSFVLIKNTPFGHNSQRFTQEEITMLIADEEVEYESLNKYFKMAYCITIDRAQGMTIRDKIQIHEVSRLTKRRMYTALSRVSALSKISFVSKPLEEYKNEKVYTLPFDKFLMGYIYGIYQNGKLLYIGKTDKSIKEIFEEHKQDAFKDLLNLKIKSLKEVYCSSLDREETVIIQEHNPPMNTLKLSKETSSEKLARHVRDVKKPITPVDVKKNKYKINSGKNGGFNVHYYEDGERKTKSFAKSREQKMKDFVNKMFYSITDSKQ
jgi:phage pi2 protein 07